MFSFDPNILRKEIHICHFDPHYAYTLLYKAREKTGAYAAYIRGKRCNTEANLFHEISAALQFPYYFGENWAAIDECLSDLEWLRATKIVLFFDDFRLIFRDVPDADVAMKILLRVLNTMVEYWVSEGVEIDIYLNN